MIKLHEMNTSELQKVEGGFDLLSWGTGFLLGQVVNEVVKETTGKGVGEHLIDKVKELSSPDYYKGKSDYRIWLK